MIVNQISLNSYMSNFLMMVFIMGIVFELPLLIYFLTRMGIVTAAFLRRYRRHAIIVLTVLSAVITPPDLFSLVLVVLPLYALYEFLFRW